jgi:succinoglycan biosynthesis protein ExoM
VEKPGSALFLGELVVEAHRLFGLQDDWLLRLIDRQQATGADLVFGLWRLPDDLNVPAWLSEITFFKSPRLEATSEYDPPSRAGTYNVLISRAALEQLQQAGQIFRPEFALIGGEDTDLFIRARSAGLKLAIAEDRSSSVAGRPRGSR